MEKLSIGNQIKIIKEAHLKIPVYRAPTEEYDIAKPTAWDKHVEFEAVNVNVSIGFLLGLVEYLSKEILLISSDGRAIPKELWSNLKQIRDMVSTQNNTMKTPRR